MIRLVTFDALHTIITPRKPIYVQYSEVFSPYLGTLPPEAISRSFKLALKQLQSEKPVYREGAASWWGEVISRTAVGAGADPQVVERHIGEIVPSLLQRFGSREGYRLFDDTLDTLRELRNMGIRTGLITNSDSRILAVLKDLGVAQYLSPVLVSETERAEKPSMSLFLAACVRGGSKPFHTLHVGDDLKEDFLGANNAGLHALLLRRLGLDGDGGRKETDEDLRSVRGLEVITGLDGAVEWIRAHNAAQDE
ncbi:HAD-like domain-containing protein [Gloeopeniophorella convolvens]|nr:HAD-like domain-containing protein [Gloeopeniophorella convolvens]